jgi:hypothetical protein
MLFSSKSWSYFTLQDLLDKDAEPGDVMECLIKHKKDNDMDEKCAAGIEHHQLVCKFYILTQFWK